MKIGTKVRVHLINNYPTATTRDHFGKKVVTARNDSHYDVPWTGEILEIDFGNTEGNHYRSYRVSRPGYPDIWVTGKEITTIG